MFRAWRGLIEEYRDRLPVSTTTPVVTLLEGGTPLVPARRVSQITGCDVHLKVEGLNPTGSFKDRGMTLAISKAVEEGAQAVICASTGNTSASAAAYAVRAGLTCAVLVPRGKIAMGKLAQALVHGARLLQVEGSFDDCLEMTRKLAETYPIALVNSVNPHRLQGQKTAAFEIVDALGDAPDVHCIPVGNAGNISAYWMGYKEYADDGVATKRPRMLGFQASGATCRSFSRSERPQRMPILVPDDMGRDRVSSFIPRTRSRAVRTRSCTCWASAVSNSSSSTVRSRSSSSIPCSWTRSATRRANAATGLRPPSSLT